MEFEMTGATKTSPIKKDDNQKINATVKAIMEARKNIIPSVLDLMK